MKRRTLVALVAAVSLAVVGLLVVILGVLTTRTDQGREQIRRTVQGVLSRRVDGRVHVGRVTGSASFFTGVTFDTLAIYDDRGELVVSTGPISVRYDVRDLMDSRIHLRAVDAQHPYVHLRQDADGCWNYQRIFRMRCQGSPDSTVRRPSAGFGHYVVLEDVRGHDVSFRLSLPWGPADSLRGARRDSAIAEALGRKDRIFRRTADGFSHTYLWQMPYAHVVRARLADPDSNRFGREIWVDTMHVNELEPPFRFRNVRMHVRTLKDSAWLYVPHFDLPGSTGSARGKVVWGSNLPMRYDISVRGDSVSLADVNWVYPTLPTTGGGTVNLHIRNDPRDLRVIEYRLSEMDMRTTGSHLTGAVTFAVGGPVLDIRNVNLTGAPLDFAFLRALNGGPFPVDWRGQIAGTVRARGGPLTRFVVDEARAEFRDANVPGAVSRFTARGGLDILEPIRTTFQSFRVDVATLDLRTIQFLYPNFPPLGGTANGSAILDSLWEDVRFRNADVTHRNGPGEPTRVTGSGRITYGVDFLRYDVALDARPLSLTMLRRAYPDMPFEGLVSGPIRAVGITPDLQLTTTLTGPGGSFSFDGRVDADSIDGYAARGRGQIAGLDPARVLAPEFAPTFTSAINGEYTVDLAGASLATLAGSARVGLERSRFDTLRVDAARGAFAFGGGRMTLTDTTVVESPVGRLAATGAIGLERDTGDSVRFQIAIDSLGGFRPWLVSTPLDTVTGLAEVTGTLHGAAVSPSVSGSVVATSVAVAPLASTRIDGEFAFRDLFRAPAGDLRLAGQAVEFGAVRFDTASLRVALADSTSARFELGGILGEESHLALAGDWRRTGATSRVLVDTVDLRLGDGRWRLAAPAPIAFDSMTTRLDSLVLRNAEGDEISLRAFIAEEGPSDVAWRATLPVEDIARLLRSPTRPAGRLTTTGTVTGTRLAPVIQAQAMLDSVGTGTQPRLRVDSRVRYADRSLELTATAFHDAEQTVTGSLTLPVAISLFGAEPVDQPLVGRINATDARLDLVESVTRLVSDVSGRISADIAIGGRMPRAGQALFDAVTLDGPVALSDGEIRVVEPNVTIRDLGARMRFQGTELLIDSIFARSGPARNSFARLSGRASLADTTFDLRLHADDFRVYDRRTLAVLDVATAGSEGLHLRGTHRGDTLTGTIDVERGGIYLPDPKLATKQIGEFDLFAAAAGTGERRGATLMSDLVRNLVFDDVNVVFGDEVYLRSTDATAANIKLSGSLAVTKVARPSATGDVRYQLALTGILNADRGTYTLDLGLLRREFNVTAGTIRFTNDTDFNPVLDIEARHNVNTVDNRGDLAVVVKIVGPLKPTPRIDLTSDQAYEIAPSDLVSYLLIGRPGFDFGQDPDVTRLVTSVLLPSASATLTRGLRALVGGRNLVDQIQFEGASPTSVVGYGDQGYLDYFYRGRWSAEKRINDRLFVSANGGLCQLSGEYTAPSGTSGIEAFGEQLGGQLRYVLEPAERISLLVAAEPSGQALACSKSIGGARGLQQTPRNISVSLLKTWRW